MGMLEFKFVAAAIALFGSLSGIAAPEWEGKLDAPAWPDVTPRYLDCAQNPGCRVRGAYFRGAFLSAADDTGTGGSRRYFLRRTFTLKEKPVSAWLQGTADESAVFRLNGEEAFRPRFNRILTTIHWHTANAPHVERLLAAGENRLEIEYTTSLRYPGGALAELFVRYADGSFERIDSDALFESSADGRTWTKAVLSKAPPAAPRTTKLNYFDLEHPQTLLDGGPSRTSVKGGERITLGYTFRGEPPKGEFEALVNLLRDNRPYWGATIALGPENVRTLADGTWWLEVPFEVPAYFRSGRFKVLVMSNSICQLGPSAGGILDIEQAEPSGRYATPVTAEMRMLNGNPEIFLDGKPFPLLWGHSYYHIRPDFRMHVGDMPYTAVTVCPWYASWHPALGKFDFAHFDRMAEDARRNNPDDAYFIWSFILYPPNDFAEKYPDDMAKDNEGNSTPVGRFSWSYGSAQARAEMKDAIDRAIRYIESSPYGNRVIGYRFATGFGTEWLGWDTRPGRVYDFSKANTEAFLGFVRANYPELADPHVPDGAERTALDSTDDILWDRRRHLNAIAYMDYYSLRVAKNALEMCGQMKETLRSLGKSKLTGTYYGYLYHLNDTGNKQNRAHFGLREILENNRGRIDFLNSPQSYHQRTIGDICGDMLPFATLAKAGIKPIIEDDTRTSNRVWPKGNYGYDQLHTVAQDVGVIRRDGATALCHCTSPYFFGIASGTDFDGPVFADLGARLRAAQEYSLAKGVTRHAEVALVASERTVTAMPMLLRGAAATGRWIQRFDHEGRVVREPERTAVFSGEVFKLLHTRFARAGAPVDYLLAEDLKNRPGDYRLYVFLNQFTYDADLLRAVERLRARDATLLWLYAPGYLKDNSLADMKELTGIEFAAAEPGVAGVTMAEDGRFMGTPREKVARLFTPVGADVVLGRYANGRPGLTASKIGKSVSFFSGPWQLDQKFISTVVGKSGVHVFSESGDPVEANDAFVMLHARFPGEKTIHLPKRVRTVVDVFERKAIAHDTDTFTFTADLHSTHFFCYGSEAEELCR